MPQTPRRTTFRDHLCIMPITHADPLFDDAPTATIRPGQSSSSSSPFSTNTSRMPDRPSRPIRSHTPTFPSGPATPLSNLDTRMTASMSAAIPSSAAAPAAPFFLATGTPPPCVLQTLSFSSATSDASLATTAAGTGTGTNSDDAVAMYARPAPMPRSYQLMMNDRQLLDSCTEAQRDMASKVRTLTPARVNASRQPAVNGSLNHSVCSAQSTQSLMYDARLNTQRLHAWINYMTEYLAAIAPGRREVLRMSSAERGARLTEQAALRRYIASYDRTVKRTASQVAELQRMARRNRVGQKAGGRMETGSRAANGAEDYGGDGDLVKRYLALLLQAIEAQCLVEGYPGMRAPPTPPLAAGCNHHDPRSNADDTDPADDDGGRYVEGQESSSCTAGSADTDSDVSGIDSVSVVGNNRRVPRTDADADTVDGVGLAVATANLRDEILAVAVAAQRSPAVPHKVGSNAVDSTKLTKDMVNRWLQLNLHARVSSSCSSSEAEAAGLADRKRRKRRGRRSRAKSRLAVAVATEPEGEQQLPAANASNSSSSLSCHSVGAQKSPAEDPVWDGFVHNLKRCSPEEEQEEAEALATRDADAAAVTEPNTPESVAVGESPSWSDETVVENPCRESATEQMEVAVMVASTTDDDANSAISENFLLPVGRRELPFSSLKYIDDIFAVHHASPNRVRWVAPTTANNPVKMVRMLPTAEVAVAAVAPHRTADGREAASGQSHSPVRPPPPLPPPPAKWTMPAKGAKCARRLAIAKDDADETPDSPPKLRSRKQPAVVEQLTDITLQELLENNIASMRPDEVHAIVRLCQTHLECLQHVLVSRTVNTLTGSEAINTAICDRASQPATVCRCGWIAHFVQAMVYFVRDYMNMLRNWRLYRLVAGTLAELYAMVRFVGDRVRWHRLEMKREAVRGAEAARGQRDASTCAAKRKAIEFVL